MIADVPRMPRGRGRGNLFVEVCALLLRLVNCLQGNTLRPSLPMTAVAATSIYPGLFAAYLRKARQSRELLGQLLERYRGLLLLDAKRHITGPLVRRIDPADVVQNTMAAAIQNIGDFQGDSESSFRCWLREVNRSVIAEAFRRHIGAEKRSLLLEQSGPPSDSWAVRFAPALVTDSTPSERCRRDERDQLLVSLVEGLPEAQRRSILLRYQSGYDIQRVANEMQRSPVAVAGLLKRGLATLRGKMREESWFV